MQPVSQSEVLACLDKINIFMMQAGCKEEITAPFLQFRQAMEQHVLNTKIQRKSDFFV
jgi:hypothetical protein